MYGYRTVFATLFIIIALLADWSNLYEITNYKMRKLGGE